LTVPAALIGSYAAEVSGTTASEGTWKMYITSDDVTLQNPVGGEPFSVGATSLTDAQLVVWADSDCPDQTSVTDGLYLISHDGDKLVFTKDHDSCGDRAATLTTTPWVKAP